MSALFHFWGGLELVAPSYTPQFGDYNPNYRSFGHLFVGYTFMWAVCKTFFDDYRGLLYHIIPKIIAGYNHNHGNQRNDWLSKFKNILIVPHMGDLIWWYHTYVCIYIHLQHPPVLNFGLLAKSTKFQPLKIKNAPGSFLEQERCPWKIIPESYPSSSISSCDSNAATVGDCWCLLLAPNQRLKSLHDMPVWDKPDKQVARMVWKRAKAA